MRIAGAALILAVLATVGLTAIRDSSLAANGNPRLRLLRVIDGGDVDPLFKVRDAEFLGKDLVVLTGEQPALRLFIGQRGRSWGRTGSGPGEFRDPADLTLAGGHILVRDGNLEKIVSYDREGRLLGSRSLRPHVANSLAVAGADTLVGLSASMGAERLIVRLRGAHVDTIMRYSLPAPLVLSAPGSPRLQMLPPFAPVPQWAAFGQGQTAFWDGIQPAILVLDRTGRRVRRIPLPPARVPVAPADREHWFATEIPTEFLGRRVFEPLRARARESVVFPRELPPVLKMKEDRTGGVWVCSSTPATGERWTWFGNAGQRATFRLPPGRELLAFGGTELAVLARDEDDVERIEIYERPAEGMR
jgi:hypothetical protein